MPKCFQDISEIDPCMPYMVTCIYMYHQYTPNASHLSSIYPVLLAIYHQYTPVLLAYIYIIYIYIYTIHGSECDPMGMVFQTLRSETDMMNPQDVDNVFPKYQVFTNRANVNDLWNHPGEEGSTTFCQFLLLYMQHDVKILHAVQHVIYCKLL